MKVQLTESELKEYIKNIVKEAIEEGAWTDSAKELGRAAKNFGKETLNKGKEVVNKGKTMAKKAWDNIVPTNKDFAEQLFIYYLVNKNVDIPNLVTHPELLDDLKKKYPSAWKMAISKYPDVEE